MEDAAGIKERGSSRWHSHPWTREIEYPKERKISTENENVLQAESGDCSGVLLTPNVPLLLQPSEILTALRLWTSPVPAGEEMPKSLQEDEMWE